MKDTREHIVKVAFKLFLLKSFKEVTMQEIVQQSKISKGAFYHYFKSKEDVFLEVVEAFYLSDEINGEKLNDYTSLKDFYCAYIVHLQKFIEYIKEVVEIDINNAAYNVNYFVMVFDAVRRFPDFKQKMVESQQKDIENWKNIVEIAKKNGEISTKMPSEYAARIFLQTIDATFINAITDNKFADAIKDIQALWDSFFEELKS